MHLAWQLVSNEEDSQKLLKDPLGWHQLFCCYQDTDTTHTAMFSIC